MYSTQTGCFGCLVDKGAAERIERKMLWRAVGSDNVKETDIRDSCRNQA